MASSDVQSGVQSEVRAPETPYTEVIVCRRRQSGKMAGTYPVHVRVPVRPQSAAISTAQRKGRPRYADGRRKPYKGYVIAGYAGSSRDAERVAHKVAHHLEVHGTPHPDWPPVSSGA